MYQVYNFRPNLFAGPAETSELVFLSKTRSSAGLEQV
jgi:hypothetical protein